MAAVEAIVAVAVSVVVALEHLQVQVLVVVADIVNVLPQQHDVLLWSAVQPRNAFSGT